MVALPTSTRRFGLDGQFREEHGSRYTGEVASLHEDRGLSSRLLEDGWTCESFDESG